MSRYLKQARLLVGLILLLQGFACASADLEVSSVEAPQMQRAALALERDSDGGMSPQRRTAVEQAFSRSSLNMRLHEDADGLPHLRVVSGFRHATFLATTRDGGVTSQCVGDVQSALRLLEKGAK